MEDTNYLLTIRNIFEYKSFSKAAELENISQPAVSARVAAVEKRLGIKIFESTKPRLIPTEEGSIVARRSENIHHEMKAMIKEINNMSRQIHISLDDSTSSAQIDRYCLEYTLLNPDVTFTFSRNSDHEALRLLKHNQVDFVILHDSVARSIRDSSYKIIGPAITTRLGVIIPPGIPLANRNRISAQDLIPYPVILPNSKHEIRHIMKWFNPLTPCYTIIEHLNSFDLLTAVATGLGYGFIALDTCQLISPRLKVLPLMPGIEYKSRIVISADAKRNKATSDFTKFLSDKFKMP